MALFSRSVDPVVARYRAETGRTGRLLAQANGPRVEMLAFVDHFAVSHADGPWQLVGWHEVFSGGWKAESDEMHWRLVDGRRDAYVLENLGQFPQVFRERVQASIAVEERFDAPGRGAVQVSARRDLSQAEPTLLWSVVALQGARLDDPRVRELADAALARLRADYDM